ncbi:hypothetical protein A0H81_02983 [Grifola frondosa]|uniref:Uncharacterized protein n=1 Tax=Grifola frondosa TaxID=5627 RepID=A0A1C7MJP9_GRIFR|nr:hypothetical protein A0H81_02983 [Grifola frondosa]
MGYDAVCLEAQVVLCMEHLERQMIWTSFRRRGLLPRPFQQQPRNLRGALVRSSSHGRQRRACKVDILIPGVLNIPHVPDGQEDVINNLPVMPIMPLLLLKLQGWSDHRASPRADMQEKQYVDVEDIKELLAIACELEQDAYQANLMWIPVEFLDDTQERVYDFLEEFGCRRTSASLDGSIFQEI